MRHARGMRAARAVLGSGRIAGAGALVVALMASGAPVHGRPAELSMEHVHPSGSFAYRVPAGWRIGTDPARDDVVQAEGPATLVRFVYRRGELGLDAAHVMCMDDRLLGPMETRPGVEYEEDFLTSVTAGRRTVYSAFVVEYDRPVLGHTRWWQRNLTMVGGGETLCVIGTMPDRVRRKDKDLRRTLEAVMRSVSFGEAEEAER